MADYKELYLKLFQASEEAIKLLIAAQQACEELYINPPEMELKILPSPSETESTEMGHPF
ncbi:hypothetical protein [Oscillibacter sp.]|uniref:hypothetical protein n=1 Tax=Oscillibacter sp. TaxID=1945593 RepID=UPI00289EC0E8|nr:hypothetical protein [Oscillibacter sp.]